MENTLEFLKSKGIIKDGNTQFVCRSSNGIELFELNELLAEYSSTLQAELEKAKELLRECQERFETILVIGVERDEVNVLIRKLNTESV